MRSVVIPCPCPYYWKRRRQASRRREEVELGQEHYDGDNDDGDGRVVDYGVVAQVPAPAATTPCDLSLLSPLSSY